ncbi:MAG: TMAO reductase system periplasmic protein TorT, partial [Chromatiales bacterium]
GGPWYPLEVDVWDPPFNSERKRHTESYVPLEKASKPWRICVSIPHLKDDYWIAVNFGLIDEARRLGVGVQLFEAGGYGNLETQRTQIVECMDRGADGLIISAISADGLNDLVERYADQGKPVVDLINGLSSPKITARAAADFWDMGNRVAQYLRQLHASADEPVHVAWFPGPAGAAWVAAGDSGFRAGLEGSPIQIVTTARADTGLAAQGELVEQAIEAHPDLDYIVGTAVTAEAAVPILRKRRLTKQVQVLAYYYGAGVHRGIGRGRVLAAPTDRQALLARIALDQIVRALEGKPFPRHVAPQVIVIDRNNIREFDAATTLPPRGFRPIFSVKP